MKILSVDDSDTIRKIISGSVEVLGFEFLEARNGQEALDLLGQEKVDLVILDWNMPILNGYETLSSIKANPEYQDIPVLMVTSESEKINVIRAIQAGAKHYLTKPFAQEDLQVRILECIDYKLQKH